MIHSRYHHLQTLHQYDQSKINSNLYFQTIVLTTTGSSHTFWVMHRRCHFKNLPSSKQSKTYFHWPSLLSKNGYGDLINFVQNCEKLNCLWRNIFQLYILKALFTEKIQIRQETRRLKMSLLPAFTKNALSIGTWRTSTSCLKENLEIKNSPEIKLNFL